MVVRTQSYCYGNPDSDNRDNAARIHLPLTLSVRMPRMHCTTLTLCCLFDEIIREVPDFIITRIACKDHRTCYLQRNQFTASTQKGNEEVNPRRVKYVPLQTVAVNILLRCNLFDLRTLGVRCLVCSTVRYVIFCMFGTHICLNLSLLHSAG